MPFYEYPRPAVTVDVILLDETAGQRTVLLIQRRNDPFKGSWALPGGFVDEHEALVDAARRELEEETSLEVLHLIQFRAYGDPGRDPRGHTVSIVFIGFVEAGSMLARAKDDAQDVNWFPVDELPVMAFDHRNIILEAMQFVEERLKR